MRCLLMVLGLVLCASSGVAGEKITEDQRQSMIKETTTLITLLNERIPLNIKVADEQKKLMDAGKPNRYAQIVIDLKHYRDKLETAQLRLSTLKFETTREQLEKAYKPLKAEADKACAKMDQLQKEYIAARKKADADNATEADKDAADRIKGRLDDVAIAAAERVIPAERYYDTIQLARKLEHDNGNHNGQNKDF